MENAVMTQEDVRRLKFNSQNFTDAKNEYNSDNRFVFYHALLLKFAYESGYISEEQMNAVSSNLITAIIADVGDKVLKISNCLYVTSLWLHSMSNWDAFSTLMTCTNFENAKRTFTSAKEWFLRRLNTLRIALNKVKSKCIGVDSEYLIRAFKCIKHQICRLSKFEGDFKNLHNSGFAVDYIFFTNIRISDCITTLENIINAFAIEVSILSKVNIAEFSKMREKSQEGFSNDILSRIQSLENEKAEKIRQLEKENEFKIKQYYDSESAYDKWIDSITKQFITLYPGMDPDINVIEFEAYLDSVEDFAPKLADLEPETIHKLYARKIKSVEEYYDKLIGDVEKYEYSIQNLADFSGEITEVTLENVVKEYALFALCKENNVAYPNSIEEKSLRLLQMPLKTAIHEFLGLGFPLSKEEIQYLTSCV